MMVTEPSDTGQPRCDSDSPAISCCSLCKQHESGSGAEDVTEWGFISFTFLQDLIDSDLPKAVQLFRSLTEQVRTS